MVAAIRLRLRSELRASWRSWLALALFAGVLGGVALTAAAGARRADTAYPRLLRWAHASNATVIPHGSGLDGYYDDLARQPSVESLAVTVLYNMALPTDSATPDTNVSVSASPDGRDGIDVDRVKIVEGRSLDAADPNAALVDRGLAAREHLRPGSTLHLLFVPNDADGTPDAARATPLDFTVSGIALFDDQVVPANRQNAAPRARLSPAFVASGISGAVVTPIQVADGAAVRLRAGATVDDLRREASSVAARYADTGGQVDVVDLGEQTAATKHALGPDAVALAAFAAMVGLVAIAVIAQLISRQLSIDGADLATMRALGMSARRLLVLAMAKVAAITVLGAAVAVGVAIGASPLMPVGAARIAEPRPGVDVNIYLLGVGFVLAALLPALVVLPAAWRLARGAPGLMGDYITAQPRLWRVTAALGSAGS